MKIVHVIFLTFLIVNSLFAQDGVSVELIAPKDRYKEFLGPSWGFVYVRNLDFDLKRSIVSFGAGIHLMKVKKEPVLFYDYDPWSVDGVPDGEAYFSSYVSIPLLISSDFILSESTRISPVVGAD